LLEGEGDCSVCSIPLSEDERKKITIRHDAGATTIARLTCPTAPSCRSPAIAPPGTPPA
jgi:hypothetical protein